jgi:hypothetical protein
MNTPEKPIRPIPPRLAHLLGLSSKRSPKVESTGGRSVPLPVASKPVVKNEVTRTFTASESKLLSVPVWSARTPFGVQQKKSR